MSGGLKEHLMAQGYPETKVERLVATQECIQKLTARKERLRAAGFSDHELAAIQGCINELKGADFDGSEMGG